MGQKIHDAQIKVFPAQMGVAVGGFDLKHSVPDFKDGDVKGAAPQVEHGNLFFLFFVQAIGKGSGRGFVDDPQDIEAGNPARILGGLALAVVKIGRNRDDGIRDGFPQEILGRLFQMGQDKGRNLGRAVIAVVQLDLDASIGRFFNLIRQISDVLLHFRGIIFPPDEAFDPENGIFRIGHGLAFGNLPDEALPGFGRGHDGRRCPSAFGIGDHDGFVVFKYGYTGIGRPEIDSDNFAHNGPPFYKDKGYSFLTGSRYD